MAASVRIGAAAGVWVVERAACHHAGRQPVGGRGQRIRTGLVGGVVRADGSPA